MRRTGRPKGLGLLAVALIVGACDAPTSSAAPTPTRAPEATPVQTTFSLFTDVWYEGLVLHVDRATATLDARGGTVDVGLRVDNPGDEPSDLNAKLTLLVAGTRIEPTRESQVPTAPAGGTAPALLSFELQGIASADDAVLEIGTAPEHVAKVPFRGGVDEAVAFQPIDLKLSGAASAGDIRI